MEDQEFLEVLEQAGIVLCPTCGSDDTQYSATLYAKTGETLECRKCNACGHEWTV